MLAVLGALSVGVPCDEGDTVMPVVADELFNTDSVTIGVADELTLSLLVTV